MAHIQKGQMTKTGEWWKHLRETKRDFWHGERKAAKKEIEAQKYESSSDKNEPEEASL